MVKLFAENIFSKHFSKKERCNYSVVSDKHKRHHMPLLLSIITAMFFLKQKNILNVVCQMNLIHHLKTQAQIEIETTTKYSKSVHFSKYFLFCWKPQYFFSVHLNKYIYLLVPPTLTKIKFFTKQKCFYLQFFSIHKKVLRSIFS